MRAWAELHPAVHPPTGLWKTPVRLVVYLQVPEQGSGDPLLQSSDTIEADCECLPQVLAETLAVLVVRARLPSETLANLLAQGVPLSDIPA
jgi:hypothetical protein